jgi:Protein of unknown function (DUF3102)
MNNQLSKNEPSLADLAAAIRGHHAEIVRSLNSSLDHAYEAGQCLTAAKAALPHGEFGPWIADNCGFSRRTARLYMQVAERWEALTAKRQRVANLPLREAVAALSDDGDGGKDAATRLHPPHEWPADRRRDLLLQWFDLRAGWFAVYQANGWPHEDIAEAFDFDEAEIGELCQRLTAPIVPTYPSMGSREAVFRAGVDYAVRSILVNVWESADWRARFSGFNRRTVERLETIADFLRSPRGPRPSPLLLSCDPAAVVSWCVAQDEALIALGIIRDSKPFDERWKDAEFAIESA